MITRTPVILRCISVSNNRSIVTQLSKRYDNLQISRCMSSYYDDARFTDRMAMLRRQQLNIQKTTMSEQLLGLRDQGNSTTGSSDTYQKHTLQYTMKELRTAYFQAAKQCHPDSQSSYRRKVENSSSLLTSDATAEERFIMVTDAYEYLRQQLSAAGTTTKVDNDDGDESLSDIEEEEEEKYRKACREYLGQPAEIVEESKRCPMFRQWLFGRTDAAFYWQSFFMLHGGLAPQLRSSATTTKALLSTTTHTSSIDDDSTTTIAATTIQRRRRPQSR
jgi:hypothetical protein